MLKQPELFGTVGMNRVAVEGFLRRCGQNAGAGACARLCCAGAAREGF